MARPLTNRELSEEFLFGPLPAHGLPSEKSGTATLEVPGIVKLPDFTSHIPEVTVNLHDLSLPHLAPVTAPKRSIRHVPLLVRINRFLQTTLMVACAFAVLGYGLDVAVSSDVTRMQEQARRLSEQNSELSAQLLKSISFQGIQENALGRVGLRVPEQVMIIKEVPPASASAFKPTKYYLPLLSGY